MIEHLKEYYNEYFAGLTEFELLEPLIVRDDSKTFIGKIKSKNSVIELIIQVSIPFNFPYVSIDFVTNSIKGYPHIFQGIDKQFHFCLNTPFIDDIEEKLKLEIHRLNEWIRIYLNEGTDESRYDYLIFPRDEPLTLFFSETSEDFNEERFAEKRFGDFDLYKFKLDYPNSLPVYFADRLGNISSSWNNTIRDNKEEQKGYWVYVENEPVTKDKTVFSTWSELREHSFPDTFIPYISQVIRVEFARWEKKILSNKFLSKKFNRSVKTLEYKLPLAIGYKIPSNNGGYEVHWELAYLQHYKAKKEEKIGWACSKNISETRFFGRGSFCNALRDLSILIIGVGALGSSAAEILVRAGIRNLALTDGDYVDSGNICRSKFKLSDYSSNKARQLALELEKISPFAKIKTFNFDFQGQPQFSQDYEKQIDDLKKYDIILDCSASNEVLYFLSHLKTNITVVSLGITNKAKQLLCLTNTEKDDLFEKRKISLYSFGEIVPPSFYEGTGCFYPTFEASFFDINALLNFAFRHINQQYQDKKKITSFHVSYESNNIEICDYKVFYQKELNFTLTIYKSCVDTIYSLSNYNYPFEFGGVLVGGYAENGKHIYITDVLLPDLFTNSYISFKGDTKKINKELLKLHEDTKGNIVYLGDWHSHPNMSNSYSSVDFKSIERQARSSTVSINNPILAIISIGKKDYEIGYYIYFDKILYKFSE